MALACSVDGGAHSIEVDMKPNYVNLFEFMRQGLLSDVLD